MDETETLRAWISECGSIAFLGGAGVSTESGIPDFRSENGIFAATQRFGAPPETLLSHEFFLRRPGVFFEYYKTMLLFPDAEPNPAHHALARLERQGKLTAVITQNIDGLHQRAGSKNVLELHGSVYRNACMGCGRRYTLADITAQPGVPKCGACGGVIKPDVVLYGEELDNDVLARAASAIQKADMLIVGGTSLVVYPAAGLTRYFRGRRLVLINLGATPMDAHADLVIRAPIGETLSQCVE